MLLRFSWKNLPVVHGYSRLTAIINATAIAKKLNIDTPMLKPGAEGQKRLLVDKDESSHVSENMKFKTNFFCR